MEEAGTLKTWVRKHSPLKGKNKPLPQPPVEEQGSTRSPIKPISGNASPSKSKSSSKLRSLLTNKPLPTVETEAKAPAQKESSKHKRSVSVPSGTNNSPPRHDRSAIRKRGQRQRSPDLRRLSQKVSDLEVQLKMARQELDVYTSSHSRRASLPTANATATNTHEQARMRTVSHGQFEGLVENLLQHDDRNASIRPLNKESSLGLSGPKAWEQRQDATKTQDPSTGASQNAEPAKDLQHKRKRSELRKASWEQIQQHLSGIQEQPRSKRSRRESAYFHRDMPAPLFSGPPSEHPQDVAEDDVAFEDLFPPVPSQRAVISVSGKRSSSAPAHHRRNSTQLDGFGNTSRIPVQRQTANYTTFAHDDEDENEENQDVFGAFEKARRGGVRPPSPNRKHVPSPSRLERVEEEFEWNDEEIF